MKPMNDGNTEELSKFTSSFYAEVIPEGGDYKQSDLQQDYIKTALLRRRGLKASITHDLMSMGRYPKIVRSFQDIAASVIRKRNMDMNHMITFSQATSYVDSGGFTIDTTTGDGLSFANAAHTLSGSSTTYTNIDSSAPSLNEAGIDSMMYVLTQNSYSPLGEHIPIRESDIDTLFIANGQGMLNRARIILESMGLASGNHEGTYNPYNGRFKLVLLPMLATTASGQHDSTKSQWWGLCCSKRTPLYHVKMGGMKIQLPSFITGKGIDDRDNITIKAAEYYANVAITGQGIVFSQPVT